MACPDPFDAMRVATESLDQDILRKPSFDDFWGKAIPKGTFPRGQGVNLTTFTVENSEPVTDSETWTETTLANNTLSGAMCDLTYNQVNVGFTERNYGPRAIGLKGPVICKDTLAFQHEAEKFLNAYEQELTKRAKRTWAFEMENQYIGFASVWVDGMLYNNVNDAPAATSELTQDFLDLGAADLNETPGASNPDSNGYVTMGEEGPLYSLYIGQIASTKVLKNDPERRADARDAFPSELWKRIGASRVVGNFRHAVTTLPVRYNFTAGHYVRVPRFVMVAATEGYKAQVNPAWKAAGYEAAIVVLPSVFSAQVVLPVTWKFPDATNYNGEWQFVVGGERIATDCLDPMHKLGQHHAEYHYAPRPEFPDHARMFIFRRCSNELTFSYCYEN